MNFLQNTYAAISFENVSEIEKTDTVNQNFDLMYFNYQGQEISAFENDSSNVYTNRYVSELFLQATGVENYSIKKIDTYGDFKIILELEEEKELFSILDDIVSKKRYFCIENYRIFSNDKLKYSDEEGSENIDGLHEERFA